MKKRGQITIFVIVGIILITIMAIFLYFKEEINLPIIETIGPEIRSVREEVRLSINDCLQEVSESSIYTFGLTGIKQDLNTIYPIYNLNNLPDNREVESFINSYVNLISLCEHQYINQTFDIKTSSRIKEDYVLLTIDYPVIIEYKNRTSRIDDSYNLQVPIRLGYLNDIINDLVGSYYNNNKQVNMNLLASYDLDISTFVVDNHLVYTLQDDSIKNEPFILMFGVELWDLIYYLY